MSFDQTAGPDLARGTGRAAQREVRSMKAIVKCIVLLGADELTVSP